MCKYHVTGWVQVKVSIDEDIAASNQEEAFSKIFNKAQNNEYINDSELHAELIK